MIAKVILWIFFQKINLKIADSQGVFAYGLQLTQDHIEKARSPTSALDLGFTVSFIASIFLNTETIGIFFCVLEYIGIYL